MTTKLEQEFFEAFGIEQKTNGCEEYFYMPDAESCKECEDKPCLKYLEYPQIIDRKLLQLLCIYNDMQVCIDSCITPCKYEDTKEMILQTLINEKTNITDYEEGTYMDVMTNQIQQLFKEEE